MQKITYSVKGMHCASCSYVVTNALNQLDGLKSCNVNIGTEKAVLEFDSAKVNIQKINAVLKPLGYSIVEEEIKSHDYYKKDAKNKEFIDLYNQVIVAFPIALIVFISMIWHSLAEINILPDFFIPIEKLNMLLGVIATIIFFAYGRRYIMGLLRFFWYKVANMDTLVGLGVGSAYIYSALFLLFPSIANFLHTNPESLYFEAVIVVVGFMLFGDYLVLRSKVQTGSSLRSLMGLQVKNALVLRNNKEEMVSIEDILIDDIVIVKPGDKIPLDGVITKGVTSIDESMITGESIPIDKKQEDSVIGGTLNKQGYIHVKITQIGKNTTLNKIITFVEKAQSSKAPIQSLADTIVRYFVPTVLLIAIITFIIWSFLGRVDVGFTSFIAILVVACPCAMGLATPIAIIVGVGKAAEQGILIKDAESLQMLSKVNYMLFDKTGTITAGKPNVVEYIEYEKNSLSIWYSLAKTSTHPLSLALRQYAQNHNVKVYNVKSVEAKDGKGVTGIINNKVYYIGSPSYAQFYNLKIDHKLIKNFTNKGLTPALLFTEQSILAYIGIADSIKPNVQYIVKRLHRLGIKTALLSGDHKNVAESIAKNVGINTVFAEVMPEHKANIVKELKIKGYTVAMVGDGINDAIALSSADVGIAMGDGSDIAIETAGVTLLSGTLKKLLVAIKLSKATMSTIKQNLFFSLFYNIIAIPIAAGLFVSVGILLSPAIEGAAMAFSSFSVVINSLKLKSLKL